MSNSTSPGTRPAGPVAADDGIEHERRYVGMLYEQLDARRADTARRLRDVLRDETVGTPQALTERDAAAAMYTDRLAALRAAEHGLAFGRLDALPDENGGPAERRYVGRIGLLDEDNEYEPLLMDWRAPAARPFYTATAASPEGMRRRRHLRTRRREVVAHRRRGARPGRRRRRVPGSRSDQRGRAAGRGQRAPHRPDVGHRGHHPGRAGRDHPGQAVRGAGGAGRAGHRQDRGRAAPGRLPALHPPRPAGPPRRAGRRAEPDVPALHRAGAAVAGGDQRGARHRRPAVPRPGRAPGRAGRDRGGQGPRRDGRRDRGRGPRPAAAARADRSSWSSSSSGSGWTGTWPAAARTRARRSRKPHNEAKRIFHREAVRLLAEQVARSLGGRRAARLRRPGRHPRRAHARARS